MIIKSPSGIRASSNLRFLTTNIQCWSWLLWMSRENQTPWGIRGPSPSSRASIVSTGGKQAGIVRYKGVVWRYERSLWFKRASLADLRCYFKCIFLSPQIKGFQSLKSLPWTSVHGSGRKPGFSAERSRDSMEEEKTKKRLRDAPSTHKWPENQTKKSILICEGLIWLIDTADWYERLINILIDLITVSINRLQFFFINKKRLTYWIGKRT